jgi:hypothetical protein
MKEVSTMKLLYSAGAFGLCAFLVACNSGPPLQGCRIPTPYFNPQSGLCQSQPIDNGTGGTGGVAGTGGTGGSGGNVGACTNMDDSDTYDALTYGAESGSDAASAIASDCVFGTFDDGFDPMLGCGAAAGAVLGCAPNCPDATINALGDCVVGCMQGIIADITGTMLTGDCGACYGASVACSAANCAAFCSNPNAPACVTCRCDNNCTPGFDDCSGLPPSGDCD